MTSFIRPVIKINETLYVSIPSDTARFLNIEVDDKIEMEIKEIQKKK